jgi:hypothetical protein
MKLSKSVVVALVVVAGLAAGTALVAGYMDKPSAPAQMACETDCDGCPLQGTEACCKAEACASPCPQTTCESKSTGCCPQEAPAAPYVTSGCGGCGMGGCPRTE